MKNLIEVKDIDSIDVFLSEMEYRNFFLKKTIIKQIRMCILLWQKVINLMPEYCDNDKLTIEINAKIYQVILDDTMTENSINFVKNNDV